MIFRLYHETAGGHVHCKLFAGRYGTLGKCGEFIMRVEEFEVFGRCTMTTIDYRPPLGIQPDPDAAKLVSDVSVILDRYGDAEFDGG